jgi:hypothetical protein
VEEVFMRKLSGWIWCLLLIFLAGNAQAQEQERTIYLGIKGGLMMPDISSLDNAFNFGLQFGGYVHQDPKIGSFAIEGEATITLSDGDVSLGAIDGDWDVDVVAAYGVYRSPGEVYFKGKLGLAYEDVTVDYSGLGSASDDDFNISLGFGVGWNIPEQGSLELEYTIIEEDIDFLSLTYNFYL